MIKVSIIMPSLNVAEYIEESLRSVLSQTLKEIEIICVDAGSTDGTLEIIKRNMKQDSRIKLIISDRKSYGYQVNIGIKKAKGQYIGIVDTDDYVSLNMYQIMYEKASQNNLDYIKVGYNKFGEVEGKRYFEKVVRPELEGIEGKYISLQEDRTKGMLILVTIWAGIYRLEFLVNNNIYFNETAGAAFQDTSFSILVGLLANNVMFLKDYLYFYRIDNVASSVKSDEKYQCVIDEYQYLINYLKENKCDTRENKLLIQKQKLQTYMWNFLRLKQKAAQKFLDEVEEEMQSYTKNKDVLDELNQQEKGWLLVLSNKNEIEQKQKQQEEREKKWHELLDLLYRNKKFIVVGAGSYGSFLLNVQNIFQMNFIEGICDNNSLLWGKEYDGYIVSSVEEAVKKNTEKSYIIANKKYGNEVKEQLIHLGVRDDQIFSCQMMLSFEELIFEKKLENKYKGEIIMPRISVIIPCLNSILYMKQCIESIIDQTLNDMEILIIDAGSTDGTLELIQSYADKDERIRIVHSQKKSYGYQINFGVSIATGKYIAIVESDDKIIQDMFEVLCELADRENADYVKGTAVGFFTISESKEYCFPLSSIIRKDDDIENIISPCQMPELMRTDNFWWYGIYQKKFLENIRFNETAGAAFQDIGALFQIQTTAKKAVYLNKVVYMYRQDNAASSSYNKKGFRYILDEYTYSEKFFLNKPQIWLREFYWKMSMHCVDRFRTMGVSAEYWKEAEEDIRELVNTLQSVMNQGIIYKDIYEEEHWFYLQMLLESPRKLYEFFKCEYQEKNKALKQLLVKVNHQKIVIFGCGAMGKFLHMQILFNGAGNVIAYCDNREDVWGSHLYDTQIFSPREALGLYPNACYIVANKKHAEEMKKQLLSLGGKEEQIFVFSVEIDFRLFLHKVILPDKAV